MAITLGRAYASYFVLFGYVLALDETQTTTLPVPQPGCVQRAAPQPNALGTGGFSIRNSSVNVPPARPLPATHCG